MEIYMHEVVNKIRDYHGEVIRDIWRFGTVKAFLFAYAERLNKAHKNLESGFATEVNNYYKPLIGKSVEIILETSFSDEDYLNISASVHGFEGYEKVDSAQSFDSIFEKATEAILNGDIQILEALLARDQNLVHERSPFGHQATLLHYCASNGVELWRQFVPLNLPDIVKLLIEHGADLKATMSVYGGEHTFESLFFTSAHPREAGIVDKIKDLL